ncbi:MAG: RluA family pseudouridine synthase [Ruminococcus sp.]|nr:RluA family pseudouridine synthase [Ruminococcus sp.]
MGNEKLIIFAESDGYRLDKFISNHDISRSQAVKLIESGNVTVGETIVTDKNHSVKTGETVTIIIPEAIPLDARPQDIPIEIVFEDDDLIVVNKPKGMVVHPAPGNPDNTLVNALLFHVKGRLSNINGVIRPGIVHRIDKNTSGLLIVAKTDDAHKKLAEQIKEHSFTREYLAVCVGGFKETNGVVDAPLGRNPKDRKKMSVIKDKIHASRPAKTEYEVLSSSGGYSYLRLKLFTGRTHQIRVHMASIGHPVFGDDVYGKPDKLCDGQCLHAAKIGFIHPKTGEYMEFETNLPDYFKNVLEKLKLINE